MHGSGDPDWFMAHVDAGGKPRHDMLEEEPMRIVSPLAASIMVLAWGVTGVEVAPARQASDTAVVRGRDDTKAQRLFGELMSPFCPGLTLATCPSPGADSLRADIRARLARGQKPQAILASYAAEWGEQILGAPRLRGWGVVLWVALGVPLLLGPVTLALWLRAQTRKADTAAAENAAPAAAPAPDDPALRKRLEEELAAFDHDG